MINETFHIISSQWEIWCVFTLTIHYNPNRSVPMCSGAECDRQLPLRAACTKSLHLHTNTIFISASTVVVLRQSRFERGSYRLGHMRYQISTARFVIVCPLFHSDEKGLLCSCLRFLPWTRNGGWQQRMPKAPVWLPLHSLNIMLWVVYKQEMLLKGEHAKPISLSWKLETTWKEWIITYL